MSISQRCGALAALLLAVTGTARAQQSYPQTLYWGSGLIDVPVAWVSPVSGDFALGFSGKSISGSRVSTGLGVGSGLNTNFALSAALFGRVEAGFSIYSDDPEWGFFGRALLVNEEQFRGRPGLAGWIPSIAVGIRNVGPFSKIDRFGLGYHLSPATNTNPNTTKVADSLHQGFSTANSLYGVVTKSFQLAELHQGWPNVGMSLSVGYGDGLFKNDGGLGAAYARHATGGVFGGVKVDFYPSNQSVLSVLAENNAWDYNLGLVYDWRGIQAGLYWTEVGAGSRSDTARTPYNYDKVAFTVGWASNFLGLLGGNILKDRVAELERERAELQKEIAARQQRIADIQLEIQRYEAQKTLDIEERRASAMEALRAEREAVRQLEERLKRLEETTPPPSKPDKP